MNQEVIELARQLQRKLEWMNPEADRDTLVWAHGFLSGLVIRLESFLPALNAKSTLASSQAAREEDRRICRELTARLLSQSASESPFDEPDSLDEIERDLAGEDPAGTSGVPVKRKPGPAGRSGGVSVPLSPSDLTM